MTSAELNCELALLRVMKTDGDETNIQGTHQGIGTDGLYVSKLRPVCYEFLEVFSRPSGK
jgi:hypothetical protein